MLIIRNKKHTLRFHIILQKYLYAIYFYHSNAIATPVQVQSSNSLSQLNTYHNKLIVKNK